MKKWDYELASESLTAFSFYSAFSRILRSETPILAALAWIFSKANPGLAAGIRPLSRIAGGPQQGARSLPFSGKK